MSNPSLLSQVATLDSPPVLMAADPICAPQRHSKDEFAEWLRTQMGDTLFSAVDRLAREHKRQRNLRRIMPEIRGPAARETRPKTRGKSEWHYACIDLMRALLPLGQPADEIQAARYVAALLFLHGFRTFGYLSESAAKRVQMMFRDSAEGKQRRLGRFYQSPGRSLPSAPPAVKDPSQSGRVEALAEALSRLQKHARGKVRPGRIPRTRHRKQ